MLVGCVDPSGPHPFGPHPIAPTAQPAHSTKQKLAKCGLAKFGRTKLAKFGQKRLAKCGQMRMAKSGFQMRSRPFDRVTFMLFPSQVQFLDKTCSLGCNMEPVIQSESRCTLGAGSWTRWQRVTVCSSQMQSKEKVVDVPGVTQ